MDLWKDFGKVKTLTYKDAKNKIIPTTTIKDLYNLLNLNIEIQWKNGQKRGDYLRDNASQPKEFLSIQLNRSIDSVEENLED